LSFKLILEEIRDGFKEVTREKRRVVIGWTIIKLFFADKLAEGDWQLDFFKTPIPLQLYHFVPQNTHFFYYDNAKIVHSVPNTRRRSREFMLPEFDHLNQENLIRKSRRRNRLSLRNFDIIIDDLKKSTMSSLSNDSGNDRYEILSSSDSE
jgi:hypothetical protein